MSFCVSLWRLQDGRTHSIIISENFIKDGETVKHLIKF